MTLALCLAALAVPAAAQAPAPRFDGIWDLIWQTRRGPRRSGYFVFRQQGSALHAELHGRGSVIADGNVDGNVFVLRGSRMLVPYRIEGRIDGDRMEGAFKAMSVDRRFTGVRRP